MRSLRRGGLCGVNASASTGNPPSNPWRIGLAFVILAVALARAALLFGTPLVPGMNGAYYLVQARSILEHGALGIPDLPLTFYLQAALAWLVEAVGGGSREASIVLAVKLADAALPALAAIPVYLLVRRWAGEGGAPGWLAPLAAALATLNGAMLRMVGDFEKNSLGLVWLVALLLALHGWMRRPTRRAAALLLVFWGLAALTHIAVFGASIVFGGLALLFFAAARGRCAWRALLPVAGTALAVLLLAGMVTLWKFDPQRIHRLLYALGHPADYLGGANLPGSGVHPGGGGPPGFPGPGGGRFRLMQSGPFLIFGTIAVAALAVCWRRRRELPEADRCVAAACAVGVLILTGPWVQGDKAERLQLVAVMPAVLAGTFALIHWKRPRLRAVVAAMATAAVLVPSALAIRQGGRAVVTEEAVAELRGLAPSIERPEKTLVSARHGLEWWAAWTLGTRIAQSTALRSSDWETYSAVYFLRSQGGGEMGPPGGGPGGLGVLRWLDRRGRPGGAPPAPPGAGNGGAAHRGGDFAPPFAGERHGPPPGGFDRPGGGPGGGGPGGEPQVPANARTVHSGAHFLLARVPSAPAFVIEQTQAGEK